MQSLGFTQKHYLTDVRLALGFAACAIAGATFYFDWTMGFDKTKGYTLYAVVAYFILNTFLTLWMWKAEGSIVYLGSRGDLTVNFTSGGTH